MTLEQQIELWTVCFHRNTSNRSCLWWKVSSTVCPRSFFASFQRFSCSVENEQLQIVMNDLIDTLLWIFFGAYYIDHTNRRTIDTSTLFRRAELGADMEKYLDVFSWNICIGDRSHWIRLQGETFEDSLRNKTRWGCGKPRFCYSVTHTYASKSPDTRSLIIYTTSPLRLIENIRAERSCRAITFIQENKASLILSTEEYRESAENCQDMHWCWKTW